MTNLLDRVKREFILEGAAVYFDEVNGVAGTAHPVGTPEMPVNNEADLRAICTARNIRRVFVRGSLVFTVNWEEFSFIGASPSLSTIDFNSVASVEGCTFENTYITGTSGGEIVATKCVVDTAGGVSGNFYECVIWVSLDLGGDSYFYNCFIGCIIDLHSIAYVMLSNCSFINPLCGIAGIAGLSIALRGCCGSPSLFGITGGTTIVELITGKLNIDASCIGGGVINLYGDFVLEDAHGAGCTVNDYRINYNNTRFFQEAVGATAVNGVAWKDLLDRSTITKPVKICGFMVTVAGGWAGSAKIRIVDGAGTTKIFPFQDEYVEGTDFASGTQVVFNFPVEVSVSKGYKFQFRSSNAADGAGKTLQLNNLDVQELS